YIIMKRLLFFLTLLNILSASCCASQNKVIIDNFYYGDKQLIAIFELHPGEYSFKIDITDPNNQAILECEIEPLN
ncbi:MAG: hypothetical protein LIO93_00770, partial [Bacteroidales bacterium]|nr:hypothetical protein [Bacteroidales bacterium]